jgi:hypothetical protein
LQMLDLPRNFKSTNTLAFFTSISGKEKRFISLTTGHNRIDLCTTLRGRVRIGCGVSKRASLY